MFCGIGDSLYLKSINTVTNECGYRPIDEFRKIEPMPKFKVGDRVRIKQLKFTRGSMDKYIDAVGTVKTTCVYKLINEGGCLYSVEFEDSIRNFLIYEEDLEGVKEMKEFTKKDLKNGDVVMKRNGVVEIVCIDTGTLICTYGFDDMRSIRNDLTYYGLFGTTDEQEDIIAVRRPAEACDCRFDAFEYNRGTLVYERKEPVEMTLEEVYKALGKEIKIVKK